MTTGSSSFAGAARNSLFGSTQPKAAGREANTGISGGLFGSKAEISSVLDRETPRSSPSGTLFGSIVPRETLFGTVEPSSNQPGTQNPDNNIFGWQSETDSFSHSRSESTAAYDAFLGERRTAPINRNEHPPSANTLRPRTADESLPEKSNEPPDSSPDIFQFEKVARASRDLDQRKIPRSRQTDFTMDLPFISRLNELTISANQDIKQVASDRGFDSPKILETNEVSHVGPSRKTEITIPAKTIFPSAKGIAVPSPQNDKIRQGADNAKETTSGSSTRVVDVTLRTTGSPVKDSSVGEVCKTFTKRDHDNHQGKTEIRLADKICSREDGQPSGIYGSSSKRSRVSLPPMEFLNEHTLSLPRFITGEGSLDIPHLTYRGTGSERGKEEEGPSAGNVISNDEDDEDNWEDIDSDDDET